MSSLCCLRSGHDICSPAWLLLAAIPVVLRQHCLQEDSVSWVMLCTDYRSWNHCCGRAVNSEVTHLEKPRNFIMTAEWTSILCHAVFSGYVLNINDFTFRGGLWSHCPASRTRGMALFFSQTPAKSERLPDNRQILGALRGMPSAFTSLPFSRPWRDGGLSWALWVRLYPWPRTCEYLARTWSLVHRRVVI